MRFSKPLSLAAASALVLTACGAEGDGLGDSNALAGLDVSSGGDGPPEVLIHDPIDLEENASRILEAGDGDQVSEDSLLEYHLVEVNPEDGEALQDSYDQDLTPYLPLPAFLESEGQNQFIGEALSMDGVTIGSEVAVYLHADEEAAAAGQQSSLYVFSVEGQSPAYAEGDEVEQSGELPAVDSAVGETPELAEEDQEDLGDAPDELLTELLIEGDGEEISEDDYVFAQYRGWSWSDGEEFDASWSEEGSPGEPFEFSLDEESAAVLQQGAIEGWNEAIPGHSVGDRLLIVVPPSMAYGEAPDEDDDQPAHDLAGETLIFVIDLVKVIDGETVTQIIEEQQSQQQPEMSQEDLEQLAEQLGVSVEEVEEMFGGGSAEGEPEEGAEDAEADEEDAADDDTDAEEDDE